MKSYSTFDIARICGANPTSVQVWIDEGEIQAYRTPGGHRRVTEENLRAFMKKHGFPIPKELSGRIRVVVVDDEEGVVKMISRSLTELGYDVRSATNGVDALLEIGQSPPDVLILDVVMPEMDGLEVIRRIKANPASSSVKVIIISGKDAESLRKKSLKLGAASFLAKPFTPKQIQAAVVAIVGE